MIDSINSHSNNKMSENDRSKTNSTNSHTNSKAGENDGSKTVVLEDMGEQDNIDGVIINRENRIDKNTRLLLNILKTELSQTITKILVSMIHPLIFPITLRISHHIYKTLHI